PVTIPSSHHAWTDILHRSHIPSVVAQACGRAHLLHLLTSEDGTDRRSALPRQPSQVSEENRTRQSGIWETAATAGSDPKPTSIVRRTRARSLSSVPTNSTRWCLPGVGAYPRPDQGLYGYISSFPRLASDKDERAAIPSKFDRIALHDMDLPVSRWRG